MAFTLRIARARPLLMWLVAVVALVAAVVVWVAFARTLSNATPVQVSAVPQTNAVVWRGRVYQSPATLARDLRRQGKTYALWAVNHPAAASLLASLGRSQAAAVRPPAPR
jgi:putative exporter of polyketide antibiotics